MDEPQPAREDRTRQGEIVYVGDPMCSWCWGISPELRLLSEYCRQQRVPFRLLVGGLRPGGGDPWNRAFRTFLKHHWQEIGRMTEQPFSYELLQRRSFNYDTEPACRSVVTARSMRHGYDLEFFAAVQRKFYVHNDDPGVTDFYESICNEFGIDFEDFSNRFNSQDARDQTNKEFLLSRSWGVSSYPTVLFRDASRTTAIATGFSTFTKMKAKLDALIAATPANERNP
jgi:putative protein-disulfide isomerase